MNWGKTPPPEVRAVLMDFGAKIAVAVEFKGKRRAVLVDNPLWEEINAEWRRAHPEHQQ